MANDRYNKILDISFTFAVRIMKLYQYLINNKVGIDIAKQVLRSGTSIGANVNESVFAQSKKDFISKMHIALKEANETLYWIKLIHASDFITEKEFESLQEDNKNIIGTLVNILKASKQ